MPYLNAAPDMPPWLLTLRQQMYQPPAKPRMPLCVGESPVGSIELPMVRRLIEAGLLAQKGQCAVIEARDAAQTTQVLHQVALWLQNNGLVAPWRDEQLDVTDAHGAVLATVERAAVRTLGITTFAVHLVGVCSDGCMWLQRRALSKTTDPGRFDTLAGGLVAAGESLELALQRETWEEAGLKCNQITRVNKGGAFEVHCPIDSQIGGYMVEQCHWYVAQVPEGVVPENQDGEVCGFVKLSYEELFDHMQQEHCAAKAVLIFAEMMGLKW